MDFIVSSSTSPDATRCERILKRVTDLTDGGASALDMSTSIGAEQGADTALRTVRKAIQEGMGEEEGY